MERIRNNGRLVPSPFDELNPAQRRAVDYPANAPLLIAAGAGTGKTKTLTHRVARLILDGADPRRILLLTFSRRAAFEMTRRAQAALSAAPGKVEGAFLPWSGTFHAIGNRLLRLHADALGLDPNFTVLDRADAADLLDLVRHDQGLSRTKSRFPKKGTCLSIYSYTVNAGCALSETLERGFPWCSDWEDELKRLFGAYVAAKQRDSVFDYDDLLLYWREALASPGVAGRMRGLFDHILVDEYQDTNAIQAAILMALAPAGAGLTVVGDDAQSIYGFRAATVRNILDFPGLFTPRAALIALETNYRSTQPILAAANAVIARAGEGIAKTLVSSRASAELPLLVAAADETAQADYIADRVLDNREAGIDLRRQAVLFRTSHHSALLEIELARRNIPFVKYGGLKFVEAAHVKDMLAVLRWAENPRDAIAAFRTLQLLPGIGPATARKALDHGADLSGFTPPAAAALAWPGFCRMLARLRERATEWAGQVGLVRQWYEPHLERLYDHAGARAGDLDQLEQIAATHRTRERFLTDLTLDPPEASGIESGAPGLDEDYLILSTIHSAKGQEWDAVFVLNLVDGCIPSDMSTGKPAQIDEERRLLYVAMTRARDRLELVHPLRFFRTQQHRMGASHMMAPRSRFLSDDILHLFERRDALAPVPEDAPLAAPVSAAEIGTRLRAMWA
ncbi:MAG TPA: ATP-dependent helicase [Stellaceae bacterium]|nr:ATP-dependent helicase [Stellaceae bacterium]